MKAKLLLPPDATLRRALQLPAMAWGAWICAMISLSNGISKGNRAGHRQARLAAERMYEIERGLKHSRARK